MTPSLTFCLPQLWLFFFPMPQKPSCANTNIYRFPLLLGKAVLALNLAIEGDRAFARVTGGAMESKFFLNR